MSLRISVTIFAGLCLSIALSAGSQKPDFIFFLTDDISAEDLEVYRDGATPMPHLERLAERGMVFENYYVATSSCSPSRCSFLTGRYPHNHGAPELHQPLPLGQVMFPAVLRRAGLLHRTRREKPHGSAAGTPCVYRGFPRSGCQPLRRLGENLRNSARRQTLFSLAGIGRRSPRLAAG